MARWDAVIRSPGELCTSRFGEGAVRSHRPYSDGTFPLLSLLALLMGGCGYNPQLHFQDSGAGGAGQSDRSDSGAAGANGPDTSSAGTGGSDARSDWSDGMAGASGTGGTAGGSGGAGGTAGGLGGTGGTADGSGSSGGTAGGLGGTGGTAGGPGGTGGSSDAPDAGNGGSVGKDATPDLDIASDGATDVPAVCTPNCTGKCGGDDGCNGRCPNTCVLPQTCGGGGDPEWCGCAPLCGKRCGGDDSCGGTCHVVCTLPETCGGSGQPTWCGCTPVCAGKCGGANGCGGNCPDNCASPQTCGGGGTPDVCGSPPACTTATGTPTWTKVTRTTIWPTDTGGCPLVHDTTRDRFVVFTQAGKTWEWNPATLEWTDRTPSTSPVARWLHGMVFDSRRNRTVLFAGRNLSGSGADYDDTWEWDGNAGTWTQRTPSQKPPAVESPGMVYDPADARTIMLDPSDPVIWDWDGNAGTWTDHPVSLPPYWWMTNMVWDSDRSTLVALNHRDSTNSRQGVWEWKFGQAAWTRVGVGCQNFPDRYSAAAAYVPGKKQVVFFGGRASGASDLNDLWAWSPGSVGWQQYTQSGTLPPAQEMSSLVYDALRGRLLLLVSFSDSMTSIDDLWQLSL